ncbi:myotubularin-related protein 9 isoform X2 [Microcaecilia unicolor]|uniref:Myotubularin-related protein 9-like isoform X2 n=1 Tax=Microcaecilia unicolor TaxID=1415580 RepID=A0A6P7ZCN9_9AMPH|nr:myotubularin-related protein 9-like isoform X2 [Microcaecilia unicolor]
MELSELIKTTQVDNVLLSRPLVPPVKGTLCITSHHLLLSAQAEGEKDSLELWLLHRNVDTVEKRFPSSSGTITLKCKDLQMIRLDFPGMEECLDVANSIEALSSLESVMLMYPFYFRPEGWKLEEGWDFYSLEDYYQPITADTDAWRLSTVNKDFTVSPSYPPLLIVPKAIDDESLKANANFRHGGRFPVLSYYHKKNGMVMLRSSQPMIGPNGKRCKEDEILLSAVLDGGERGYIIDTRSPQAAKQARMKGGGTETKANYPYWKRLHRPLERGRSLQESFIKLMEACNEQSQNMDRWLGKLEASKWLSHVKDSLSTACLAAQCLEREEACVLVHGSEGTDTTLIVTALAQVILDPDYRTISGFQALIEREWIQAGHPFQLRCSRAAYSHSRVKHEAPIFLLFMDCCWQLGRQFPFSMEFNEHFLSSLIQNAYASEYGTFLCNNEKERCLCALKEKTHSLWCRMNHPSERRKFLNPLYERNTLVIWPSVEPQSMQLWTGFFLQWMIPTDHITRAQAEIWRLVDLTVA